MVSSLFAGDEALDHLGCVSRYPWMTFRVVDVQFCERVQFRTAEVAENRLGGCAGPHKHPTPPHCGLGCLMASSNPAFAFGRTARLERERDDSHDKNHTSVTGPSGYGYHPNRP